LFAAIPQDRHVFGAQFEQRAQRGPGTTLGTRLEIAACQDENGDPGGNLEIDVAVTGHPLDGQFERVRHT
jgi:hypothetical protein